MQSILLEYLAYINFSIHDYKVALVILLGCSIILSFCGATNHQNGYIFSDFTGFCMTLHDHQIGGDSQSCFPLQEHFM